MSKCIRPVIVACRQHSFTPEQLNAFREYQPLGLIIFAEPCEQGPKGVQHVVEQFCHAVGRNDAPILIDNEGGKVLRFKPKFHPDWREVPSAQYFAELAQHDLKQACEAIHLNAQLIALDMIACGVNVNCAPVIDVLTDDTFDEGTVPDGVNLHAASADMVSRALGRDVNHVTQLAWHFADGLMTHGVTPIIKHMPGLGRMKADPHYVECRIDHSFEKLDQQDFEAFRRMKNIPVAMTSHGIYTAIDPDNSATLSAKILQEIVREKIGFKGAILADTIEMNAIWPEGFDQSRKDRFGMGRAKPGTLAKLTQDALTAGCDVILHSDCSGEFQDTIDVLEAAPLCDDTRSEWLQRQFRVTAKQQQSPDQHRAIKQSLQQKLDNITAQLAA